MDKSPAPAPDDSVLEEILGALEMPPHGLRKWFDHIRAFCNQHGGERHYAELLQLMNDCTRALDRQGEGRK